VNRRTFLQAVMATALPVVLPPRLVADTSRRRVRPADPGWPSPSEWKQLGDAVGGNLLPVDSPLAAALSEPDGAAARRLWEELANPYAIGEQPGLTESLGWMDAWASKPSVYAVAARHAQDIAAAVNFARDHDLRLVVKGGGHSYQGTSNAPDSILIWTRHMTDITMHGAFVPQGCERIMQPQPAVTLGAGVIGMQAYRAVTTEGGKYVQGGGCLTVGLAGLVQSGGFGSFSKRYGTAAGSLLEAEVVTADGQIRIANAATNPDLFWALKGGGGGTFGVVSKLTTRLHELPEFFGIARAQIKAASDAAYRELIGKFVGFYRDHLCNEHWGEQVRFHPDNALEIEMLYQGLDADQATKLWQPFADWVSHSPDLSVQGRSTIGSVPARRWWDPAWWQDHWPEIAFPNPNGSAVVGLLDYGLAHVLPQPAVEFDRRPGAGTGNMWWKGNSAEAGLFWWGYQSLWLPESLLDGDAQPRLADALFAASRHSAIALHFNKGLAGAPPDAIAGAQDTAMNPAVLTSFALAIAANGQRDAYPGFRGHEPSAESARQAATQIDRCMDELRAVSGQTGAYVSESNYFERDWQRAYWGTNHPRLAELKQKYDPDGLFFVHHGVGSEEWSADGFTKA
jgi:FAD/FMN-containing dehydrogenase